MKHFLLPLTAVVLALCSFQAAEARNDEDQNSRHIIVTLNSGEKVEGYLHRGWQAESSVFKKENYSFKMKLSPDDDETIDYTADDVKDVEYTETTENNPDGIRWESRPLAAPSLTDRYRTLQRLLCVYKGNENATIYWWKLWVSTGQNMASRRIATFYGIRFHNDPEGIVYNYGLVSSKLMDKKYPGLKDFCLKWFKGPEGKARKKEAKENELWILDMYDAYLAKMKEESKSE